jgi:hypothetical protein
MSTPSVSWSTRSRLERRAFLDDLRDRYAALHDSRLPGIGDLRAVLRDRGEGYVPPAGELSRRLRALFASVPNLPPVEWEATPPWLERGRGRVDALIPDWHLVVEGDGRAWHARVADFEYDRWRDAEALAHGYGTLRFTAHQLASRPTWSRNVLLAASAHRSGPGGSFRAA